MFLKFVWGRTTIPDGKAKMKIDRMNKKPPDNYLPVSHTCFFTLDLPKYSSIEIMREKLLYAIINCKAIDLDGAAGEGWED